MEEKARKSPKPLRSILSLSWLWISAQNSIAIHQIVVKIFPLEPVTSRYLCPQAELASNNNTSHYSSTTPTIIRQSLIHIILLSCITYYLMMCWWRSSFLFFLIFPVLSCLWAIQQTMTFIYWRTLGVTFVFHTFPVARHLLLRSLVHAALISPRGHAVTCSVACPLLGKPPNVCDHGVGRANPVMTQTVNWLSSDLYPSRSRKVGNGGLREGELTLLSVHWLRERERQSRKYCPQVHPGSGADKQLGEITDMTFCHRDCTAAPSVGLESTERGRQRDVPRNTLLSRNNQRDLLRFPCFTFIFSSVWQQAWCKSVQRLCFTVIKLIPRLHTQTTRTSTNFICNLDQPGQFLTLKWWSLTEGKPSVKQRLNLQELCLKNTKFIWLNI